MSVLTVVGPSVGIVIGYLLGLWHARRAMRDALHHTTRDIDLTGARRRT